MARNNWEEALQAILTGGMQGYQTGQASNQEMQKTLMMEQLKAGIKQKMLQNSLASFNRPGSTITLRPKGLDESGNVSYEFTKPEDIAKEEALTRSPRLANLLAYTRQAIASGASPSGVTRMTQPQRFSTPEEQKQIESAFKTGKALLPKPMKQDEINAQLMKRVGPLSPNATEQDKQKWLNKLPPRDASLVKSITSYNYDINRGLSFKDRERIGSLVTMYDHTFSMPDFNARMNYKNEMAKGKIGANVRSYNTVLGHLGSLNDTVNNPDLPSNTIKLLEKGQRGLANQFMSGGKVSKAMASENTALTAVAGEMANIFKNSGGTDQEIGQWLNSYDKNAAREYKQQWIKQGIDLIQSRMGAIGYDYERVMGKPYDKSLISPKASEVLNKINSNQGTTYSPKTQSEYNSIPSGSIYIDTDGQTKRKR